MHRVFSATPSTVRHPHYLSRPRSVLTFIHGLQQLHLLVMRRILPLSCHRLRPFPRLLPHVPSTPFPPSSPTPPDMLSRSPCHLCRAVTLNHWRPAACRMAVSTLWSRVYRDRMSVGLVRSLTVGARVLQVDGLGAALSEAVWLAMLRLWRVKPGVMMWRTRAMLHLPWTPVFPTVCSATHTPLLLLLHRSVGR